MRYSTTLLLLAATPLFSQGRKPDLENDQVRVLVVTEQPHVKTSLHKHDVNRVMIYLNAGKQEFVIDGKKSEVVYKAGEAKWSPAGGMHTAELMSGEPMKIVEVEIKKPGDPAKAINTPLDPVKIDKQDYHVEFENNQVRVVRVKMAAHRKVPEHEHQLESRRSVCERPGWHDDHAGRPDHQGAAQTRRSELGRSRSKHREENLMDNPFEAVVVELKN